jgi:hypothetical protein
MDASLLGVSVAISTTVLVGLIVEGIKLVLSIESGREWAWRLLGYTVVAAIVAAATWNAWISGEHP